MSGARTIASRKTEVSGRAIGESAWHRRVMVAGIVQIAAADGAGVCDIRVLYPASNNHVIPNVIDSSGIVFAAANCRQTRSVGVVVEAAPDGISAVPREVAEPTTDRGFTPRSVVPAAANRPEIAVADVGRVVRGIVRGTPAADGRAIDARRDEIERRTGNHIWRSKVDREIEEVPHVFQPKHAHVAHSDLERLALSCAKKVFRRRAAVSAGLPEVTHAQSTQLCRVDVGNTRTGAAEGAGEIIVRIVERHRAA